MNSSIMFPTKFPSQNSGNSKNFADDDSASLKSESSDSSHVSRTSNFSHPDMPKTNISRNLSIDTADKSKIPLRKFTRAGNSKSLLIIFQDRYTKQRMKGLIRTVSETPHFQQLNDENGFDYAQNAQRKRPKGQTRVTASGFEFDGARILSKEMLDYHRSKSVSDVVSEDRKSHAAQDPESILGWQILILASPTFYLGVFVITGTKRNWRGKVKYRLSHRRLPDLWVPLRCAQKDCGEEFWLVKQVLGR